MAPDLRAQELRVSAANDIVLNTEVTVLHARTFGMGDIVVRDRTSLQLQDVQAANGSIDILASEGLVAQNVRSLLDAPGNNVRLTSLGEFMIVVVVRAGETHGEV
ncbi:hypothetical protein RZS08_43790, partial [Arthrospira platensis SPKY1]|nr:hypothetical protein [Arthrospira platensis SPKY1]